MVVWQYNENNSFLSHTMAGIDIENAVRKAKDLFRLGIGYRSKVLYCHPNNLNHIRKFVKQTTEHNKDVFIPFPYRVMASSLVPETVLKEPGKNEWLCNNFFSYAEGPADPNMSMEDYLSMCKYFGYVRQEYVKCAVFYEVDDLSFKRLADELNTKFFSLGSNYSRGFLSSTS